jgi:hypothetical protein
VPCQCIGTCGSKLAFVVFPAVAFFVGAVLSREDLLYSISYRSSSSLYPSHSALNLNDQPPSRVYMRIQLIQLPSAVVEIDSSAHTVALFLTGRHRKFSLAPRVTVLLQVQDLRANGPGRPVPPDQVLTGPSPSQWTVTATVWLNERFRLMSGSRGSALHPSAVYTPCIRRLRRQISLIRPFPH